MQAKERISQDMKDAMRAKEANKLSTIRMLLAAIKQVEVDERIEVSDDRVMEIVIKMIKQRQDSVKIYRDNHHNEAADKEQAEIDLLQQYLPAQLSDVEVQAEIQAAIAAVSATSMAQMGQVMAIVKPKLNGVADMGKVSKWVKDALNS
ncbi:MULTISPECIES: GatB/YqeY domain-containing protein [Vitreoscilla]|uniref:GatB/YqeY domain-containing protein n=1 Tax=Vitreoscilla stercoraria TaxID=61 RepID=A0ABY4ED38_VITST|nr:MULTISPECIES: GatB/YqeY domain-containing protein [Vitreoscilla]AUZ05351.1 Yqey-like protein [Vitreoscilla sp. C1]UOO93335.1 GatB/YqeY domain-containing protein [Vitreoscilla stercoraria]